MLHRVNYTLHWQATLAPSPQSDVSSRKKKILTPQEHLFCHESNHFFSRQAQTQTIWCCSKAWNIAISQRTGMSVSRDLLLWTNEEKRAYGPQLKCAYSRIDNQLVCAFWLTSFTASKWCKTIQTLEFTCTDEPWWRAKKKKKPHSIPCFCPWNAGLSSENFEPCLLGVFVGWRRENQSRPRKVPSHCS